MTGVTDKMAQALRDGLDALTYQGTMGKPRRQRRHAAIEKMREALAAYSAGQAAAPKAEARLLYWCGPSHYPVPHGGIAARTYAEFPKEAADNPDSYWKNGPPLYAAPQPPAEREPKQENSK